jgi:nucleolar GTP-binding protein
MPVIIWKKLPTVLLADELLDKAYRRATKAKDSVEDTDRLFRTRKQMIRMIQSASDVLDATLKGYVAKWPSLDKQSEFDRSLIDASVGCDAFRHHLSNLQWAANQTMSLAKKYEQQIQRMMNIDGMHVRRREAYGRISSVIDQVNPSLLWLNRARDQLRELPSIDTSEPCIVVAGSPNVGKSALIGVLSSNEPEVAAYPFTTKQLHVGHFEHRRRVYQMVDTPGLLDRPMEDRNNIEMQAIVALENIGSIVLFLLDPAEHGGTSMESQENLLSEVAALLPQTPLIVVDGKADLLKIDTGVNPVSGHLCISATEGYGIEQLREELVARIAADDVGDPLLLPEGWHRSDR